MTHTLHRTSNADAMYGLNTLDDDFVFLSMSAKGFPNEKGSAEKMKQTLRIAQKHNPVNIGDMITGNMFTTTPEKIINNVRDTSIVHAVFANIDDAAAFAKEVKEAGFGISLVIQAPFDRAWKLADMAGCIGHTIEYSGGIWGRTEKLPAPDTNDLCTMCGHGMVSRYLVEDMVKRIKAGRITAKAASAEIARQCCCGIYNPVRGEKLLAAMAAKRP